MLEALTVLGLGLALGISLAAPPGPILALSADRTVRHGFWPGVVVPLGATTGDATHALLMGLGIFPLLAQYPTTLAIINLVGGGLLLLFAWFAVRSARRHTSPLDAPAGGEGKDQLRSEAPRDGKAVGRHLLVGGFGSGYLLALTSPFNFAWWLSAGTALFRDYGLLLFVGFFAAIVAYSFVFVAVVDWARSRVRNLVTITSYASALMLALFGILVLVRAVAQLT